MHFIRTVDKINAPVSNFRYLFETYIAKPIRGREIELVIFKRFYLIRWAHRCYSKFTFRDSVLTLIIPEIYRLN